MYWRIFPGSKLRLLQGLPVFQGLTFFVPSLMCWLSLFHIVNLSLIVVSHNGVNLVTISMSSPAIGDYYFHFSSVCTDSCWPPPKKIFILVFSSLTLMCLNAFLFIITVLGLLWAFWIWDFLFFMTSTNFYEFHKWKNFTHYLSSISSLYYLSDTKITYLLHTSYYTLNFSNACLFVCFLSDFLIVVQFV